MHYAEVSLSVFILCFGCSLIAQDKQTDNTTIPSATPVTAVQEMFRAYCAWCRGLDGKGNGPSASALKSKPPDLTQLSKTNGGEFPG